MRPAITEKSQHFVRWRQSSSSFAHCCPVGRDKGKQFADSKVDCAFYAALGNLTRQGAGEVSVIVLTVRAGGPEFKSLAHSKLDVTCLGLYPCFGMAGSSESLYQKCAAVGISDACA